jgi:arylsulfatase A-like enzyme
VFVSDHGEAFGEHGYYFAHGFSAHEEELHIPLVFYDSAGGRVGREATPVSLMDVAPTLLALAGVETDLPLDGMPLDRRIVSGEIVVAGWRPGEAAAYRGPMKLLADRMSGDPVRVRVHDLDRDPGEIDPAPDGATAAPLLMEAVERVFSADPLLGGGALLERQRWEGLSAEEIERLRSLGYVAPGAGDEDR